MSSPLRIGFVVEGPTDRVVLESVVQILLGKRDFEPVQLCPELSENLGAKGGGGWTSVYFWCKQAVEQAGGKIESNPLFDTFDVLIVLVDADVAGFEYGDDQRITNPPADLPCHRPCPPARSTTDALRCVILGWMGESDVPAKTVICIPSKTLETWVLVALFPENRVSRSKNVECHPDPEAQLQSQPLKQRLIRSGTKDIELYRRRATDVSGAWPRVRKSCGEAERFSVELVAAIPN